MHRHSTPIISLLLASALLLPVHAGTQPETPVAKKESPTRTQIDVLKQQLQQVLRARLAAFEVALQDTANTEMKEKWEATTKQIDRLLVQLAESEKQLSAPSSRPAAAHRRTRSIRWFAFGGHRPPTAETRDTAKADADGVNATKVTRTQTEREFHRILKTLARRIEAERHDLERAQLKNDKLQAKTETLAQAVQQLEARIRDLEQQTPGIQEQELAHARDAGLAFSGEERSQAVDDMLRARRQLRTHEDVIVKHRDERAKALRKTLRSRQKAVKKQRIVDVLEEKVSSSFQELEAAIQAHPTIDVPEYVQRLRDSRQGKLLADTDSQ